MSAARACGLGAKSSATLPETDRSRVRYQTNWPRGSAQRKARGEEQVAAMECYRRAMIGEQTFEGRRDNLSQANKLSRTYALLLDVLNRHRGKGQQKVTVEHVHVHSGSQAIVGVVETPGGGDRLKLEEQPHAASFLHMKVGGRLIGSCRIDSNLPLVIILTAQRQISTPCRSTWQSCSR
jgi:hypothetical protein